MNQPKLVHETVELASASFVHLEVNCHKHRPIPGLRNVRLWAASSTEQPRRYSASPQYYTKMVSGELTKFQSLTRPHNIDRHERSERVDFHLRARTAYSLGSSQELPSSSQFSQGTSSAHISFDPFEGYSLAFRNEATAEPVASPQSDCI